MSRMLSRNWESCERECRAAWERTYPNVAWYEVNDGYRYGWEQAQNPRYQGLEWRSVENELRSNWSDWESLHCRGTMAYQLHRDWESLRQCVRYGWERARSEIAA